MKFRLIPFRWSTNELSLIWRISPAVFVLPGVVLHPRRSVYPPEGAVLCDDSEHLAVADRTAPGAAFRHGHALDERPRGPNRAPVAHDQNALLGVLRGDPPERRDDPLAELVVGLAGLPAVAALVPRARRLRDTAARSRATSALAIRRRRSRAALAARVTLDAEVRSDDLGRLARTGEVARVDELDRLVGGQLLRERVAPAPVPCRSAAGRRDPGSGGRGSSRSRRGVRGAARSWPSRLAPWISGSATASASSPARPAGSASRPSDCSRTRARASSRRARSHAPERGRGASRLRRPLRARNARRADRGRDGGVRPGRRAS